MKKEPKKLLTHHKETLKRKSVNELKEIAKLQGIKNRGKLKKRRFNY